MAEGALRQIQHTAFGEEATIYATPGTFTNPRGLEAFTPDVQQDALPDERHTTSRHANYAPHPGEKNPTLTFRVPAHADVHTDLDFCFKGALGAKNTDTFVFDSGDDATITASSGTFTPIILATMDGVPYARPVKSVSAGTATLAIKLPSGSTVSAAKAPASDGGALYYRGALPAATYIHVEYDRDGETDTIPYALKGGVVDGCTLTLDLSQRLGFDFSLTFGDWVQAAASNAADPDGPLSGMFLGAACEAFIQDIGTPAAGVQLDVSTLNINLAHEIIERNATRAPGGTIPGSARSGIKYSRWCVEGLSVTLTRSGTNPDWVQRWNNRTPLGAFFAWYMGVPQSTSTEACIALWLPRVVLSAPPAQVDVDGLEGLQLTFTVEDDTSLTSPANVQGALAFFKPGS